MTLWFDVEDLITHFQHAFRPTGIQRLTFEIYREVWQLAGASGDVRFCRHGATPAEYIVVDWPGLEAGILAASAAGRATQPVQPAQPPQPAVLAALAPPVRLSMRGRIHHYLFPRITPAVRMPLGAIYRAQKQTLRSLRDLTQAIGSLLRAPGEPAKLGEITVRLATTQAQFAAGDVFIALGASWGQLNAAAGREVQQRYGIRFAVLLHDLIPELYPEWTSREGLPAYQTWLREVVPHADKIFAVSQHTARDLQHCMAAWNKPIPAPAVLPVGYRKPQAIPHHPASPFDRKFILFVSTIEVRKNHALLFRVWRRLLETMNPAEIPYLVFAGKIAWLTGDFMVQLENSNWLDGHVKLVESPSESELATLYQTCAFTVFPSLYEGWGLPVTESLSFGKTVAASNRAAIPEAGGDFCRYFDPENTSDAYAVIRLLIENPEQIRLAEARIAEGFRPPGWAETAAWLLAQLRADYPARAVPGIKAAA